MKFHCKLARFFVILVMFTNLYSKCSRWPNGIITTMNLSKEHTLFLAAKEGFMFVDSQNKKKYLSTKVKFCCVRVDDNHLIINDVHLAQQALIIYPRFGAIVMNGQKMNGMLYLKVLQDRLVGGIVGSHRSYFQDIYTRFWQSILAKTTHVWYQAKRELLLNLDQVITKCRQKLEYGLTIRVLLDEWNKSTEKWIFTSTEGFVVSDAINYKKRLFVKKPQLTIAIHRGSILLDGKRISSYALSIKPINDYVSFDGIVYNGSFQVIKNQDSALCINCLDIEDYVCSVLRTESWPGWPLEVNKAFAIVSRSYVIAMICEARKNKRMYHVKNTNAHQTYQGVHNSSIIKQSVEQTKGIFLGFEGKPVLAMFDSCCGGIIPAHIADFNFDLAPYLARDYACTHCKRCKIYSWQVSYDHDVFEQLIVKQAHTINRFRDIKVIKKDKAGLVNEVKIKGLKSFVIISGKKLYSMFKEIKSFCFNIKKKSGKIIFNGRGFGHHLGLCQWGAREMVRDGWDYKQILSFYYPGTHFMRLT